MPAPTPPLIVDRGSCSVRLPSERLRELDVFEGCDAEGLIEPELQEHAHWHLGACAPMYRASANRGTVSSAPAPASKHNAEMPLRRTLFMRAITAAGPSTVRNNNQVEGSGVATTFSPDDSE